MATPGADRETGGNRGQPVLSSVPGRSMGRATGGLRGTLYSQIICDFTLPKVGLGVLGVAEISRMRWVESGQAPLGGVTSCQSLIKGISRLLWPENSIRRSSVIQPGSTRQLFLEVFAKNDWNCGTISVPLQCGH